MLQLQDKSNIDKSNSYKMGSDVTEIKKLSDQLSQMRQENIALKVRTDNRHLIIC